MPDMAQPDFDSLGAFRAIAQEYGGTPQGITSHIRKQAETITTLTGERDTARAAMPKDDELVVKKKDAEELAEYRKLGKPAELTSKLTAGEKAASDLEMVQTRTTATAFAKAAGLADEAVDTLIAIPDLKGAKFEVRKVKVKDPARGGAEVEQEAAYLTLAGEGQHAMAFSDAESKVPVLKGLARVSQTTTGGGNSGTSTLGAPFVGQTGGTSTGNGGRSSVFDQIRQERNPQPAQQAQSGTVANAGPIPITQRLGLGTR